MGLFDRNNKDIKSKNLMPVPQSPLNTPRAMTAAATIINIQSKSEAEQFRLRRASQTAQWQTEAWEYYDAIGEIKYAFNMVASVVSRIRLYAATVSDPSEAPISVTDAPNLDPDLASAAERALARLDSAYGGQAGLLKDAALNLSVTGECYLVQVPERTVDGVLVPESWDIRSVDELHINDRGEYLITPRRDLVGGSGKPGTITLPKGSYAGRIWRAHPRFSEDPDSSLRGLLDLCAELLLLNRTFRATARSRLNAGMLYVPDGMATASGPDPAYPDGEMADDGTLIFSPEEAEDEFEDQLIDAMTTPISDEESASAVVPLIVRGPAELADKLKHTSFERSFDDALLARSDRVLERILQGLDVPKDTVTGLASVKYSNAVQIDESLYKAHIEPLLLLISDALTVVYLRPYLRSIGYSEDEVKSVVVWYDPSAVATRNDRASDADSGFEKMAVSFSAWRRAHGFSDADAPDPTEVALRLLSSKGSFTPELTEAMLAAVAPGIMQAARDTAQADSVAPIPDEVENILNGGAPTGAPEATPNTPQPTNEPGMSTPADPGSAPVTPPLAEPTV